MGSREYTIWIDEGQALLGEFNPKGTVTDVDLIRFKIGPPMYPTDEICIYFREEADMVATAKTLRRMAETLERTLWPELEPELKADADWGSLGLGVMGC